MCLRALKSGKALKRGLSKGIGRCRTRKCDEHLVRVKPGVMCSHIARLQSGYGDEGLLAHDLYFMRDTRKYLDRIEECRSGGSEKGIGTSGYDLSVGKLDRSSGCSALRSPFECGADNLSVFGSDARLL